MTNDLEALDALEEVDQFIRGGSADALDAGALCSRYKAIKPKLIKGLALVERIPVYGSKIGTAIRFLMAMADLACPA